MSERDEEIRSRVTRFLGARLGGAHGVRVENLARVASGRSRENWVFDAVWLHDDGERREPLIVRRDPLGGLLRTDRGTEFAVLRALEGSAVQAPRARWLDATGAELGRPSLVMRREPGGCDYYLLNGDRPLEDRLDLAGRFCDLLAAIHLLDWRAAGLGEVLDDPGPEAARAELDRWEAILRRDQLEPYPELELVASWLRPRAPRSDRTVLVHGDFKPGNALLEGDRIVALLDWELAHLGDPVEDLGWVTQPLRAAEHQIPGVWERAHLLDRYRATTGWEVDEAAVEWWNVLACYKTAVMQVSGLAAFVAGQADELYRPTATVLRTMFDLIGA